MFVPSLSWQNVRFYIQMAQKCRFAQDAEGPRDDLWNDAIGELVAEWEQREGERDAERGSARRVRQLFGRL